MSAMEASRASTEGVEKIVRDLSGHLSSALGSFGYQYHGIEKDDLLQEIRIKVWKTLSDENRDIRYFNAYLRKIIYSVFINEINRVNKENRLLERGGPCLSVYQGGGSDGAAMVESMQSFVEESLEGLKPSRQAVVKLRLQGLTLTEIARLNQWSYRKTCNIFYRGLKDIKRRLGEKGIHYED